MQINANIYNHLSSSLIPKRRSTTHKSSELKAVYNNMSRYNKNSPLYLLSLSESKQEHMINIKEAALTLRDVTENLSNPESDIYSEKVLVSDNEQSVTGSIKSSVLNSLPEEIEIEISSLATEQVNVGNYVRSNNNSLYPKEHKFVLETINANSHFSISVSLNEPNISVQNKLVQYINNRNLGVTASLLKDGASSAVMLISDDTGVPSTDDGLYFSFTGSSAGQNIVDIFGLNNISTLPSNSSFKVNGDTHSSASNHISINRVIELDFHKPTDEPVNISFVTNTESVKEQLNMFINAYNGLVDMSEAQGRVNAGSRNLMHDISIIVDNHREEFEATGLQTDEDGHIVRSEAYSDSSLADGRLATLFGAESTIRSDIFAATQRLTIDPIAYINKLIVTYPNSHNKLNTSYTQSVYSGLIYNNYA